MAKNGKSTKEKEVKKLEPVVTRSPIIYFPPEVMAQLEAYIVFAKGEISGLGLVEKYGERDFLVPEIFLLKQECSAANTTLDPAALAQFAFEFVQSGRDMGRVKLWWHSHNNFAVSWSDADERTIQGFGNEWMISVVGNKNGDFLARADVYSPIRVTDRGLWIRTYRPFDAEELERIKAEVVEKVTFKAPKPVVRRYSPPRPPATIVTTQIEEDGEVPYGYAD